MWITDASMYWAEKTTAITPFFRERGLPYMNAYDPGTDTWSDLPGLPRGLLGAVAAVIDDHLYLTTGSLISVFHGQSATYRRPWKP